MENTIKNLEVAEIMKILETYDTRHVYERVKKAPDKTELKA